MSVDLTWDLLSSEEVAAIDDSWKPTRLPSLQCLCGRFAKAAGSRHYYNGSFNCFSYDVDCSRCGIVTVECV